MIKKFYDFINESQVIFQKDFVEKLEYINSEVSNALLNIFSLDNENINYNNVNILLNSKNMDLIEFYGDDKTKSVTYKIDINTFSANLSNRMEDEIKNIIGNDIEIIQSKSDILTNIDNGNITNEFTIIENNEIKKLFDDKNIRYLLLNSVSNSKYYIIICITSNAYIPPINIKSIDGRKSEIKVGRYVKKILTEFGYNFTEKQIEEFVNMYKSEIKMQVDGFDNIKEVSGDDIKYYYNYKQYYSRDRGTLGSSCMRGEECQSFFGIYQYNDKCSLIIMTNDENLLVGRALLWKLDDGKMFMDRVYTYTDSYVNIFIKYAVSKGYYYKSSQDSSYSLDLMYNYEVFEIDYKGFITLDDVEFNRYPYLDTFKYLNMSESTLSNDWQSNYDYELESTNGTNGNCEYCNGDGKITCTECYGDGDLECEECYGKGTTDCRNCDGDGSIEHECYKCDGIGTVMCDDCDGDGCDYCDGDGSVNCPDCDGDGYIKHECEECDGDGDLYCSECSGEGNIVCWKCDGDGEIDCDEC